MDNAISTVSAGPNAWGNKSADELLTGMKEATAAMARLDDQWAARFNSFALTHGFDLDKGDVMIVPSDFDMEGVPPRYRASAVRASPLVTGRAYFIDRRTASPFSFT